MRTWQAQRRQSAQRGRRAFALVEFLIVIVALVIIAGMVIPEFQRAAAEARLSSTLTNLYELTTAVERYKMHHDGDSPYLAANALPQLLATTDGYGDIATGVEYPFGPYLRNDIPLNLLSDTNKVYQTSVVPPANLKNHVGWLYDPDSGQIWAGEGRLSAPGRRYWPGRPT